MYQHTYKWVLAGIRKPICKVQTSLGHENTRARKLRNKIRLRLQFDGPSGLYRHGILNKPLNVEIQCQAGTAFGYFA